MTGIKICGLRRIADAEKCNMLKPDFAGVILCRGRKRSISYEEAKAIRDKLSPEIKLVGVFLNDEIVDIVRYVQNDIIQAVQLHGQESDDYIDGLKSRLDKDITVIKAVSVTDENSIEYANRCKADLVLLDSGIGGTGKNFDWSFTKKMKKEFILAGGLNCDNVKSAIKTSDPRYVDVSSGVETDGYKDFAKMKVFCDNVRDIENGGKYE